MSLIDRTIRTLTMFKRFTYFDSTTRDTVSPAVYGTFTLTAPSDRSVLLLGARFSRDSRVSSAVCCGESWIAIGDSGTQYGLAGTSSTTRVTLRTHFWIGSLIPPGESALFAIWFRHTASYTVYLLNVRVDVLYVEVEAQ